MHAVLYTFPRIHTSSTQMKSDITPKLNLQFIQFVNMLRIYHIKIHMPNYIGSPIIDIKSNNRYTFRHFIPILIKLAHSRAFSMLSAMEP
jgi:hypothetical protein